MAPKEVPNDIVVYVGRRWEPRRGAGYKPHVVNLALGELCNAL